MRGRNARRHLPPVSERRVQSHGDTAADRDGVTPPIHRRSMTELFILSNPAAAGHSPFGLLRHRR